MDRPRSVAIGRVRGRGRALAARRLSDGTTNRWDRRRIMVLALLVVCAAGLLLLRAALTSGPRTTALSGPVAGNALVEGAATMGLDPRTQRAFILTGEAVPGQRPPHGAPPYLDVLDTTTGALVRAIRLGPAPFGLVVDSRTARMFVADPVDGTVRLFDARTGAPVRTISLSPLAANAIALDDRTGRVFVASTLYNAVVTLDARSGAVLHTVRDAGDALAVDVPTGRVFAFIANNGGGTNAVTVLDARTGAVLHSVGLNQPPQQVATLPSTGLVAIAGYTNLLLIDGRTGRVRRTVPLPFAPHIVGDAFGRLLISESGSGQRLALLDERTGRLVRTLTVGPGAIPPLLDPRHGHIIATSGWMGTGHLWVLDARRGTTLQATTIAPNPVAMALAAQAQRVLIVSQGAIDRQGMPAGPGSLAVLDARSGRLLRTITLTPRPTALLNDEATGHVFVILGGGVTPPSDTWGWVPPILRRWVPFLPTPPSSPRINPSSVRMWTALP